MGELIYVVNPKDSIEIIKSLEISFFLLLIFFVIYIINKLELIYKKNEYINKLFVLVFIFMILNIFVDYYISSKLSVVTEKALLGKKNTKIIEGIVKEYQYVKAHKHEHFKINNIYFLIKNNHKIFFKNYLELLKNEKLKLRIEYIDFPRHNTTVIRIWKLN